MKPTSFRIFVFAYLLLVALLFQSCDLTHAGNNPRPVHIDNTLTLIPTVTEKCPPVTPAMFLPPSKKPKVIYALIDRSGSYSAYTNEAKNYLLDELSVSLEPGDRVYLVWLGANENPNKKYLFAETVPALAFPEMRAPISTLTPTSIPTFEVLQASTYTPTGSVLKEQERHKTETALAPLAEATNSAVSIILTNTATYAENNIYSSCCEQFYANKHNGEDVENWRHQKRAYVEAFVEKTLRPLMDIEVEDFDGGTHVYNSLFYAARTLTQIKDGDEYDGYYLIILSDMEDIGSEEGEYLDVNLSGINVLVAMATCGQSIECQRRADFWTQYFREHGATLPSLPFRLYDENVPYIISDFLNSGGIK